MLAGWQPGDGVVHTGDNSYLPFLLYLPEASQSLLAGDPEHAAPTSRANSTLRVMGIVPVPVASATEGFRRAWLVLAPDHSVEFQQTAAEEFGRGRTLVEEQHFGGVVLRLYDQ